MGRKTIMVHRHCGARVVNGDDGCPYCPRCMKWLVGDSVHRIKKPRG